MYFTITQTPLHTIFFGVREGSSKQRVNRGALLIQLIELAKEDKRYSKSARKMIIMRGESQK